MARQDEYGIYLKEISHLIYWISRTYNAIITSQTDIDGDLPPPNTTGPLAITDVAKMTKLIAEKRAPETIPALVFRLFDSIIATRDVMFHGYLDIRNAMFTGYPSATRQTFPDKRLEEVEEAHKSLLGSLAECRQLLSGDNPAREKEISAIGRIDALDLQNFVNVLIKPPCADESEDEDAGDHGASFLDPELLRHLQGGNNAKQKARGRKKGKTTRNSKAKRPKFDLAKLDEDLAKVPVRDFRIIHDQPGRAMEGLLAAYALMGEWMQLRSFIQDSWREVAYNGQSGAVTACVSFMATEIVRSAGVVVEPDCHDSMMQVSYVTVLQLLTRGQIHWIFDEYRLTLGDLTIDAKEWLMMYTYEHLVDFIKDFQQNRSGKPTKALQAQLRFWYPNFDFESASKAERLQWRRLYTINWLYDLINVHTGSIIKRLLDAGQKVEYENVDWAYRTLGSISAPGNSAGHSRWLLGLSEFAGFITALAMQKPSTSVCGRILPSHVFQLQCIIDSLTVSRGWTIDPSFGHVLSAPALDYQPCKEIDKFLDREGGSFAKGYAASMNYLSQFL